MSAILMTKQANLLDVPVPSIGDVVVFVDADGQLKTRESTGAVNAVKMAGRFVERNAQYINQLRTGVAAGQTIQSTVNAAVNAGELIGKVIRFAGQVKVASSEANETNSFEVRVGGLIIPFPSFGVTVSTQYFNYDIWVSVLSANTASAFLKTNSPIGDAVSIVVDVEHGTVTGLLTTSDLSLVLKNATTSNITTNFGYVEVI